MEFTPIPNLEGYYMSDSVAVWHEVRGKKVYLRPYMSSTGLNFYVKVWEDGRRRSVAVKTLAKRTFGPHDMLMPDDTKRLPDYPAYRFHIHRGIMRVFKDGKEIFASRHPKSETPRFTLTNYDGKRSTVSDETLKVMFANSF